MSTRTPTSTDTPTAALLAVERAGPGHAVTRLRPGARLAPRVLSRGSVVRAALVPTQAGPLAGDRDVVSIEVGAGAVLALEPIAATLALPGPREIRLDLHVSVAAGGRLVLDDGPLIVTGGANVVRRVTLALGAGARAAVRETGVLGRHGEEPGRLDARLRVTLEGEPLLHDELRLGPESASADAHVALAPGHRAIGSLCLLGLPAPAGDARVLALAGPGAVRRATGDSPADLERELGPTWAAWVREVLRPAPR